MRGIIQFVSGLGSIVVSTILAAITAGFLYLLSRWSWRWFLVAAFAAASLILLVWLPRRFDDPSRFLSVDLPARFRDHFWLWTYAFGVATLFSALGLARAIRSARPPATAPAAAATAAAEDPGARVDAAWDEVVQRLGRAGIDPGRQHVYLLLAPDAGSSEALVQSAGLQVFASAPEPPSPIRAYAIAEGLLLDCTGASGFGTQEAEGAGRLEGLCRRLLELDPDCPVVRGVVVIVPIDWAADAGSIKGASALRDDLGAIRRALKVRCPVFALFTRMEAVPGFGQFVARLPASSRQNRVGFAIPGSAPFDGDLLNDGLAWLSAWFQSWTRNQMAEDLFDQAGNGELLTLDHEIRRSRRRLRAIMESAFATHREAEPTLFLGCYLAATGPAREEQAFAAGLLRGPRGRVIAEHLATEWSAEAREDDRRYRRLALGVGIGGCALALAGWAYILSVKESPLWWGGPVAVLVAWGVAIARLGGR